jgi:hypothetical protein
VLSCVGRDIAMGRYSVQGVLPKYLKGFTVSKLNYDSENDKGPIPLNVQAQMGSVRTLNRKLKWFKLA